MDHCLRIPEVLVEIFDHLESDNEGHSTIVTLARTSSKFHDFAARILWKEMYGLEDIRCLFAPETFQSGEEGSLHLGRDKLSQLENGIPRLKRYARHVQILRFNFNPQYPEDDQFEWRCLLRFLAHPNFPKPIFPNLIELTLPCFENTETMLYASLTLAPSVRIVTVLSNSLISPINTLTASTLSKEESLWKALADQLDSFSGGITSFTISSWQFHGFVPAEVLGVVDKLCQKFTALATLRFPKAFLPPTPFQLPPRLKKLELSIRSLGNPQDEINLPNLTNLQLSVTHIESCNSFLRVFRATKLESLTIHYSSFSINQSINLQDAFIALLTSANFPHLSSVIVQGDTRGFDQMYDRHPMHLIPPTTFPVTYGVFKPLMACQNMTSITISNCIPTEISNAEFLRMLSAWPNLTALNLASPFQVNSIPQLTWAGLQTALLCCPSLTHLDLPCDARILPHTDVAPHPSLSYWNARGSALESPKEAAKVFQTCFPKLKVLRFFEEFCAIDFDFEMVDPLQAASFVNWRQVHEAVIGGMA